MGQAQDLDMMADRRRLGHTQALLREHCRENNLRRDYERERAYGVAKQPRGLGRIDFKNRRRRTSRAFAGIDPQDVSSYIARYEDARSSKEICKLLAEDFECLVSDDVAALQTEPLRRISRGLAKAYASYPQIKNYFTEIQVRRLESSIVATVDDQGILTLNKSKISLRSKAIDRLTRAAIHEAGHLFELYLCRGDADEYASAKHTERLLKKAAKEFVTYSKEHDIPLKYKRIDTVVKSETANISVYPLRIAQSKRSKSAQKAVFHAESFAELFVRIVTKNYETNSFIDFLKRAVDSEIKR